MKKILCEKDFDIVKNEIICLKKLKHTNVIKLHGVFRDDDKVYMVTDLCDEPTLFDFIVEEGKIGEEKAKVIIKNILQTLIYMHS